MQVWAYYGGMLAYYWLLATPAMGFVFGLYLYISVCWFHVHYDEVGVWATICRCVVLLVLWCAVHAARWLAGCCCKLSAAAACACTAQHSLGLRDLAQSTVHYFLAAPHSP